MITLPTRRLHQFQYFFVVYIAALFLMITMTPVRAAGPASTPLTTVSAHGQLAATKPFNPEVPFPGFSGPQQSDSSLAARYIKAIYVYFIWTVGLLATIMIIFGGFKWIAAAGNPGQINDARTTINNAVIGLIIALTSVLILNVINPDFVNLGLPGLKPVKGTPLAGALSYKDANGNCLASNEIPCGFTCTDTAKNQKIFGACTFCAYSSPPDSSTSCGHTSKDSQVLARQGNCLYPGCPDVRNACTFSSVALTPIESYGCQAQTTTEGMAAGGYTVSTIAFSLNYDCGTIWYQRKSNGIVGIGGHPEALFGGTKCPAKNDRSLNCMIDYGQHISAIPLSSVPAGQDLTKIGTWPKSSCQ